MHREARRRQVAKEMKDLKKAFNKEWKAKVKPQSEL
jgi:hypothetical protein